MDDDTKKALFEDFPLHGKLFVLAHHGRFVIDDFLKFLKKNGYTLPDTISDQFATVDKAALKEEKERLKLRLQAAQHLVFCLQQLQIYSKEE